MNLQRIKVSAYCFPNSLAEACGSRVKEELEDLMALNGAAVGAVGHWVIRRVLEELKDDEMQMLNAYQTEYRYFPFVHRPCREYPVLKNWIIPE